MTAHRLAAPLLALVLGITAAAPPAFADTSEKAAAEQLFRDAKALMDVGKFKEACPKLEQSLRLDPSPGSTLRLAYCYEQSAQLASAWARYGESLAQAKAAGNKERIEFCRTHITDLEPRLSRITVLIPNAPPGTEVQWDGRPFVYGSSVPVDGGTHELSVSAAGKKTWSTKVDIAAEKDSKTIRVPPLDDVPSSDNPPVTASGNGTPTAAYILGIGGVVLIGGAVVAHLVAIGEQTDRRAHCAQVPSVTCDDDYKLSAMRTWEGISYAALGVGVAAVGVGVGLYFTSKSSGTSSSSATPSSLSIGVGTFSGGSGLRFTGAF